MADAAEGENREETTEPAIGPAIEHGVASTDEWLPVSPVGPPELVQPVRLEPRPAHPEAQAEEEPRPGPAVIVADTWDFVPDEDVTNEAYHGRRRAYRPAVRTWLVVALVLTGLGAAVAIPFALNSGTPWGPAGAQPGAGLVGQPSGTYDEGLPLPVPTISRTKVVRTPGPVRTTVSPSASVRTAPLVGPSPPPKDTATPTLSPMAPFAPLNIEAEAPINTVGGSAARTTYAGTSGGELVGYLGKIDSRPAGTLQFNDVVVPTSGTYALTFWYVANNDRTAIIWVNGGDPTPIGTVKHGLCCDSRTLEITLRAGANTILFTNPTERCPAIDRIMISQT
jgi:hypothetical protein